MEIHRQICQNCGSIRLKNIIFREHGEPDKVFVQCNGCQELVARYIIMPGGYYHHKKEYDSFLRGVTRGGDFMSGKNIKNEYEKTQQNCQTRFEKIINWIEEEEQDD